MAWVIVFAAALFFIGILGVLFNRTHAVRLLLAFELIILAAFLVVSAAAAARNDPHGYAFGFLVLTAAAAESALGLALLIAYHRIRGTEAIDDMRRLQG